MNKLESLITERKKELQELEDNRGTRFPVIEQATEIQIAYITKELSDLEMLLDHDKYELNENQQIVLDWLQGDIQKRNPFASIKTLVCRAEFDSDSLSDEVKKAYNKLDKNQEFHVLRTFGEWGLSREAP